MTVPAVAFLGRSGTGKTTLIEKLIPEMAGRGYRVGAVKHDAHRFDIDHPGKDSFRFTAAGAETMLITSSAQLALVKKHASSPPAEELLERYFPDLDIVLIEGFSRSPLPKIEIRRKEKDAPMLCRGEQNDPALIAFASDHPLEADVPVLDLNDTKGIADFIEDRILGRAH